MAQFIDRRLNGKNKSAVNRQRFIRRHKQQIKESVADAVNRRSITNTESGEDVTIPHRDISEPIFHQGKVDTKSVSIRVTTSLLLVIKLIVHQVAKVVEAPVKVMPARMAKGTTTLYFKFPKMNIWIFCLKISPYLI